MTCLFHNSLDLATLYHNLLKIKEDNLMYKEQWSQTLSTSEYLELVEKSKPEFTLNKRRLNLVKRYIEGEFDWESGEQKAERYNTL